MKKLTILLVIFFAVVFVADSFYELKKPPRRPQGQTMDTIASQTTNRLIANYVGVKISGSKVKALFDLVETLNIQEVFPIAIRYGEVLPNSYEWNEYSKSSPNLNSGDAIQDSDWYEVVIQDQLPKEEPDAYYDTIIIRAYQ